MAEQSIPVSVPAQGKSRLLILGVGTAILIAVFTLVWLQSAKYEPLAVGKPAPDFSLSDLNDKPYRLSDFRGKVVFPNFWATWCKPCREEMPAMEILNKNFEKDGLVTSDWDTTDNNRRARYYTLTPQGKKYLAAERANFDRYVSAIHRVLQTA